MEAIMMPVDYNCDVFQSDESIIPANNLVPQSQPSIFFVKMCIQLSTYVEHSNFTLTLIKTSENIVSRFMTFDELEDSSLIRTMITSSYPMLDTRPDMWLFIMSRISQCAERMVRDNAGDKILSMVVMIPIDEYVDDDDEEVENDEEVIPIIWRHMEIGDAENVLIGETDDQVICAICLELIRAGTQGYRLPCQHVYHRGCIRKWLSRSRLCPCAVKSCLLRWLGLGSEFCVSGG